MTHIDEIDAKLLDIIQRDFPLVPHPFNAIAEAIGIPAAEVMSRIERLKSEAIIRQISAIFDSAALGYRSALVAFKIQPELLDSVASQVVSHPSVSHCYSRDAEYNLWFTITIGPDSDLDCEVQALSRINGVLSHITLPATRIFKIGVFLEMSGQLDNLREAQPRSVSDFRLSTFDFGLPSLRQAVRALQKDLPIIEAPFAELACETGMSEGELIDYAKSFLADGVMRRFAAVLRHQRAGYSANAMVCWRVPESEVERIGAIFAAIPAVSHCYERAIFPDWPYSLYTMVHKRTEEELNQTISELAASAGSYEYRVLHTLKEYKKSRVQYFL